MIRRYWFYYQICGDPISFIRLCFINRCFDLLQFHTCDSCHGISIRKPFWLAVRARIYHQRWYCEKCQEAKNHLDCCARERCIICDFWREYLLTEPFVWIGV